MSLFDFFISKKKESVPVWEEPHHREVNHNTLEESRYRVQEKVAALERKNKVTNHKPSNDFDNTNRKCGHWMWYRIGELNELSQRFTCPGYSCRFPKRTQDYWNKFLELL